MNPSGGTNGFGASWRKAKTYDCFCSIPWPVCVCVCVRACVCLFVLGAWQDLSLVVSGSTGKRNSRNIPYTQFYVTSATNVEDKPIFSFVSLQPVAGPDAEPSQTMVSGNGCV